jgi:hypothetical protein
VQSYIKTTLKAASLATSLQVQWEESQQKQGSFRLSGGKVIVLSLHLAFSSYLTEKRSLTHSVRKNHRVNQIG